MRGFISHGRIVSYFLIVGGILVIMEETLATFERIPVTLDDSSGTL